MITNPLPRLERFLFETRSESRTFAPLRYLYAILNDLIRGELTLRAMSLVYTTLLTIVPLLALCFSVLKGLGYHRSLEPAIYQFLQPIGDKAADLTKQAMEFVDNIRGGVLGSLGLVFLLYWSVSMIQKIEGSFNFVWRVKEPRAFGRRVSEYISVLLIGPGLIIAALSLLTTLGNQSVVKAIAGIAPFGTLLLWLSKTTPYVLVAGVFTFMYAFVPNTKVQFRAALIGGATAGLLWAASGIAFASFVSGSRGTVMIYAGFAIVILALIWLYWSWLILLVGAQLAFYVQHPQYLRPTPGTPHLPPSIVERLGLSTMFLLGSEFMKPSGVARERYSLNALAKRLFVPSVLLEPIVARLLQTGLLAVSEDESLMPGRDLGTISLSEILRTIRNSDDSAIAQVRSLASADAIVRATDESAIGKLGEKNLLQWITEHSSQVT